MRRAQELALTGAPAQRFTAPAWDQPLSSGLEVPSRAKQSPCSLATQILVQQVRERNRYERCQEVIKAEKENKTGLRVGGRGVFVKFYVGWA